MKFNFNILLIVASFIFSISMNIETAKSANEIIVMASYDAINNKKVTTIIETLINETNSALIKNVYEKSGITDELLLAIPVGVEPYGFDYMNMCANAKNLIGTDVEPWKKYQYLKDNNLVQIQNENLRTYVNPINLDINYEACEKIVQDVNKKELEILLSWFSSINIYVSPKILTFGEFVKDFLNKELTQNSPQINAFSVNTLFAFIYGGTTNTIGNFITNSGDSSGLEFIEKVIDNLKFYDTKLINWKIISNWIYYFSSFNTNNIVGKNTYERIYEKCYKLAQFLLDFKSPLMDVWYYSLPNRVTYRHGGFLVNGKNFFQQYSIIGLSIENYFVQQMPSVPVVQLDL